MNQSQDKLQKLLANQGLGSRRVLERIIAEGRIKVNGETAALGMRASIEDTISIDGRVIRLNKSTGRKRILMYHKPEGEICARRDPQARPSVFDALPNISDGRWIMVGRLDLNSSGLLLFTNDGTLAQKLMHPSYGIVREYAVRILGTLTDAEKDALTKGITLEDGNAKFENLIEGGGPGVNRWYHVTLTEGKKREVRRLFESQGYKVSRLIRTRYGVLTLPKTLRKGRFIELNAIEVGAVYESVGLHGGDKMGATVASAKKQMKISTKAKTHRQKRTAQKEYAYKRAKALDTRARRLDKKA